MPTYLYFDRATFMNLVLPRLNNKIYHVMVDDSSIMYVPDRLGVVSEFTEVVL